MPALRLALLQLKAEETQAESLRRGLDACRDARAQGADIALFPEMWSIGYAIVEDPEGGDRHFREPAISMDDAYIGEFQFAARRLKMAIAITYLENWKGARRNSVSLIDRHGSVVLDYAKVHTCAFDAPESSLTPGTDFPVCSLNTAVGDVQTGCMVCFDREFPESARLLMLNGAELILVPNCCQLEQNRLAQLRARAFENTTAMAVANYPKPQCNGNLILLDGMAFGAAEESRHMTVVKANDEGGIFVGEIDLAALRVYRKQEPWVTMRRPASYSRLTRVTSTQ
jgi:predicted amidohydrolase